MVAHPLLLTHAVSELHSITKRLYEVVRLLFPALPAYGRECLLKTEDWYVIFLKKQIVSTDCHCFKHRNRQLPSITLSNDSSKSVFLPLHLIRFEKRTAGAEVLEASDGMEQTNRLHSNELPLCSPVNKNHLISCT